MKYKQDIEEAKNRLTALWHRQPLDRPCISVVAPSGKQVQVPELHSAEDKWMSPDWVLQNIVAQVERLWWGGEAMPSALLMAGWVVCLGGTPKFEMNTIWFDVSSVDFDQPSTFVNDLKSIWPQRFEKLYCGLAETAGKDDFLVGQPCILPANDLLSMHMGTEDFLMALIDHPDWMLNAIMQGAREQQVAKNYYQDLIKGKHDFWYGNAGWMPMWAPEPYVSTQSDVSCMLSPDMFEEFVVPELDVYGAEHNAVWYHLDGGDARQHLPCLLSLPYMRVIQYTPAPSEPPNGPEHMDFYKTIQEAGRIVHIELPKENVEPLIRELDPGKLALKTYSETPDDGMRLLDDAVGWAS